MSNYDVAVVGLGAMGSASLYALAKRGARVIGLERSEPANALSSSFGESRIFRMAYFEHPDYVPLLRLALAAWRDFEAFTGEPLLTQTGIIEAGHPLSLLVARSRQSAIDHALPFEDLTPAEVSRRFPAFALPSDWQCLFQPDAGVLLPEKAIRLFVRSAEHLGAEVALRTAVTTVVSRGAEVELKLISGEIIRAASAIIAAGPWLKDLVPELGARLHLTRQPLTWFKPLDQDCVAPHRMPVFLFEDKTDLIYGFPDVCGTGVKAASHLEGEGLATAESARREPTLAETARLRSLMARYVPAASGPALKTHTCVYTKSPDEHFVLGLHPVAPNIVLASPCSGHGFKFTSLFGEVLADLALEKTTSTGIELFGPARLFA